MDSSNPSNHRRAAFEAAQREADARDHEVRLDIEQRVAGALAQTACICKARTVMPQYHDNDCPTRG